MVNYLKYKLNQYNFFHQYIYRSLVKSVAIFALGVKIARESIGMDLMAPQIQ